MNVQQTLTPEILVSRLGDYLVEKGLISRENLESALSYQNSLRAAGEAAPLLGQILIQMGFIDKQKLDEAITEQILQLRSALQEANQRLEQRVKERTAELEQALARLSEVNQLKTNFVANISHELRTPLTHLKGYVELLLTQDLGSLSSQQLQALQVIQRSSDRLGRLIEDLIMFSVMERGSLTLNIQPVNISVICTILARQYTMKAAEKKIALREDFSPSLPAVLADEQKIQWAIQQLLDNAIKFTPSAGQVTLSAELEDRIIRIMVSDTGIGIPTEHLDEIYEPFHQLDGSSTRRFPGTGIGLTLARRIVEAHGSALHVHSELDKGSQFAFSLAIAQNKNES
jgi:signal transduction histidine kinase